MLRVKGKALPQRRCSGHGCVDTRKGVPVGTILGVSASAVSAADKSEERARGTKESHVEDGPFDYWMAGALRDRFILGRGWFPPKPRCGFGTHAARAK